VITALGRPRSHGTRNEKHTAQDHSLQGSSLQGSSLHFVLSSPSEAAGQFHFAELSQIPSTSVYQNGLHFKFKVRKRQEALT
jgi:hypothetical protein